MIQKVLPNFTVMYSWRKKQSFPRNSWLCKQLVYKINMSNIYLVNTYVLNTAVAVAVKLK